MVLSPPPPPPPPFLLLLLLCVLSSLFSSLLSLLRRVLSSSLDNALSSDASRVILITRNIIGTLDEVRANDGWECGKGEQLWGIVGRGRMRRAKFER